MTNKKLHFCLTVLLAVALIATLLFDSFQVNTVKGSVALHTVGSRILDADGRDVYLRGIGRAGDIQSASGMWSGPGSNVFNWDQKWYPITDIIPKMDATLQCYRDSWHVNMIRIFVSADWWWIDTINPTDYQPDTNNVAPISFRTYLETLVVEAAKYGIYVDFCPYSAVNAYWLSGEFEGEPLDWVPGTASYDFIQNVTVNAGRTEAQFWSLWWTSVVQRLGNYSNVIFELWNEPGDYQPTFFNYTVQGYQTIRGLGNQNLIFMQWQPGIVPGWQSLTWAPELYSQLKAAINGTPQNIAFTTHTYMHSPAPNLQWGDNYTEVKDQLNSPDMVPQTRSPTCTVPLVFNEMGVLDADYVYSGDQQHDGGNLSLQQNRERDYSFWDAILHNARDMGIGVCAYYWMQDGVATAYGFAGESLVKDDVWTNAYPMPNSVGQTFINYG